MKIEVSEHVTFTLEENQSFNKIEVPYIFTIWGDDNEIVIYLSLNEFDNLKKEVRE